MYHAVLVAALGAAATPAADPVARPNGPAPQMIAVKYDKEGALTAHFNRLSYKPETRVAKQVADGKEVEVAYTTYVPVYVTEAIRYPAKDLKVFGLDGLPIDADKLPKLLAKETMVLISHDGRPVDSFYTQFFKEGTLVIVPPAPKLVSPPPPAVPRSETPRP
jgi:hypothetical protein